MAERQKCVLYDRDCIDCGECDRCDLDPTKVCDNCMKCVMGDQDYRAIEIERVEAPSRLESGKADGASQNAGLEAHDFDL